MSTGAVALASCAVAVGAGLATAPPASAGSGPLPVDCSVTLVTTSGEASVEVVAGCTGTNLWLVAWKTPSDDPRTDHPQVYYASTDRRPWVLPLPPCYWQVDFVQRSTPPPGPDPSQRFIAGKLGGTPCPASTTTTSPTVTTPATTAVPPTTPATTSAVSSTTVTTRPGSSATSTTAAPGSPTTTPGSPPTSGPGQGPPPGLVSSAGTPPGKPGHKGGLRGLLPFTGAGIAALLAIAAALVALGTAAVGASRARRRPLP